MKGPEFTWGFILGFLTGVALMTLAVIVEVAVGS